MSSYCQLFDLRSGNLVAEYANEHDAWAALRRTGKEHGPEELQGLGLLQMEDDQMTLIAMEDELVRRAMSDEKSPAESPSERDEAEAPNLAGSVRRKGDT
jgi:hypothetical protein